MRSLTGLKDFIQILEDQGDLQRVQDPVDPRFEIAAILSEIGRGEAPVFLFENVKGHSMALVGNLLGTKRRLALAIGLEEEQILRGDIPNLGKRIKPRYSEKPDEREFIKFEDQNSILNMIPVLTHYANDSGPYITSGITSARDPRNGGFGRGLHRMEVRGDAELGITLNNPPLSDIYAYHRERGTRMELASAVGVDPGILVSTVLKMPGETDKFAGAGGLMGQAVSLDMAQTVDVSVPADSEIIIEGYIDPREEERAGTLGEVSGYYLGFPCPTIHVTAISFLKNPLYQSFLPWSFEIDHLLSMVYGLNFIPRMQKEAPSIKRIHFVPGTFASHVVLSIENDNRGEIRNAMASALSVPHIKKVVMVNEDIDPSDPLAVEWAMATRFQAERDSIILSSMRGQVIDPSGGEGFMTAKLGLDATRPDRDGFEKVDFPSEVRGNVAPLIQKLKGGE